METIRTLSSSYMTFSAYIRRMYPAIEEAIRDGTPLDVILKAINGKLGTNGTLAAMKSALQRIRSEMAAKRTLGLPPDFVAPPMPASHFPLQPYDRPPSWAPFNNFPRSGPMSRL